MNQVDDALKLAIDDVNSVANALHELREKTQAYGEATNRLDKVSDALIQLSDGVTSMRTGIASIVQRAESIDVTLTNSHSTVENITAAIPDVIARIEASDTSKSITEFTKLLGEVRDVVRNQQDTTLDLRAVIDGFAGMSAELRNIKEALIQPDQMLQLLTQVLMENVAGPARENARLLGELKDKFQRFESTTTKSNDEATLFHVRFASEIEIIHTKIDKLQGEPSKIVQTAVETGEKFLNIFKPRNK